MKGSPVRNKRVTVVKVLRENSIDFDIVTPLDVGGPAPAPWNKKKLRKLKRPCYLAVFGIISKRGKSGRFFPVLAEWRGWGWSQFLTTEKTWFSLLFFIRDQP